MNQKQELGKFGEEIATNYLKQNGYEIIQRNFKAKQGEIDIIARQKEEIIFVEVKTRKSLAYGLPIEAVNEIKQKHIYRTAQYYLYLYHLEKEFIRLDIIEIYKRDKKIKINHIKNAF